MLNNELMVRWMEGQTKLTRSFNDDVKLRRIRQLNRRIKQRTNELKELKKQINKTIQIPSVDLNSSFI